MATVIDLINQISDIKKDIATAINEAYGATLICDGECFENYAEYIRDNLCACDGGASTYIVVSFDSNGGTDVGDRLVARGTYVESAPITIQDGYDFIGWALPLEEESEEYELVEFPYTPTENITLTAVWEPKEYTVATVVSPVESGVTQIDGDEATATVEYGTTVIVNAIPNEGYKFAYWSDFGAQEHEIIVTGNMSLTAFFTPIVPDPTYSVIVDGDENITELTVEENTPLWTLDVDYSPEVENIILEIVE